MSHTSLALTRHTGGLDWQTWHTWMFLRSHRNMAHDLKWQAGLCEPYGSCDVLRCEDERVCAGDTKKLMFLQPARLLFHPLISFSRLSTSACYYAAWQLNGGVICVTKQEFYPRESLRECFTKQDKTCGSVATHSLWVQLVQAVYVFWKRRMVKEKTGRW